MCRWGTYEEVPVYYQSQIFEPSELKLHSEPIDACIAAYVAQMNRRGIITVDCCCGHGKYHDGVKARPLVSMLTSQAEILTHYGYEFELDYRDYKQDDGTVIYEPYLNHWIPDSGVDHSLDWTYGIDKKEDIWIVNGKAIFDSDKTVLAKRIIKNIKDRRNFGR